MADTGNILQGIGQGLTGTSNTLLNLEKLRTLKEQKDSEAQTRRREFEQRRLSNGLKVFDNLVKVSKEDPRFAKVLLKSPSSQKALEPLGIGKEQMDLLNDAISTPTGRSSLGNILTVATALRSGNFDPSQLSPDVRALVDSMQKQDFDQALSIATRIDASEIKKLGFGLKAAQVAATQKLTDVQTRVAGLKEEKLKKEAELPTLTLGEVARDKEFGKEAAKFSTEISDKLKNISQLQFSIDALESGENLTGPAIGSLPRTALAISNPKALEVIENIEEVVQRNLRLVLGAQFTEKEGTRLIERAFNPRLDEKTNAVRVKRLFNSIKAALDIKQAQVNYFNANGTLKGFTGRIPTLADIEAGIDDTGEEDKQRILQKFGGQ